MKPSLDLSGVVLSKTVPTFSDWPTQTGVFVDSERFFLRVLQPAKLIEGATFTANGALIDCLPVRRLVTVLVTGTCRLAKTKKLRFVENVHTKLYIINKKDVYVGSMNLVQPSWWHNVMVRVNDERQKAFLRLYFESLWNSSAPFEMSRLGKQKQKTK